MVFDEDDESCAERLIARTTAPKLTGAVTAEVQAEAETKSAVRKDAARLPCSTAGVVMPVAETMPSTVSWSSFTG